MKYFSRVSYGISSSSFARLGWGLLVRGKSLLFCAITEGIQSFTLQTRQLPVGDALWIARHKVLRHEYVLDFIVERKRVDDLWSSIKDNRYKEQKLRLQVKFCLHYFQYLLCSIMLLRDVSSFYSFMLHFERTVLSFSYKLMLPEISIICKY